MRLVMLAAVAFAVAATAAGAAAPGRLTAKLVSNPPTLQEGTRWQAAFVLRRAGRPASAERASFWIRGANRTRSFRARAAGSGRYRADVVFSAVGKYQYGVRVGAASIRLGSALVQVAIRSPLGLAVGPDGALYAADREGTTVVRIDPRTRARTVAARGLDQPLYLAFDAQGRLAVADSKERIYRAEPDGSKTLLAGNGTRGHTGDGGPATAAALGGSGGMDYDAAGNLVLAEYDGWIRVIRADGTIRTVSGNGTEGYAGDGGPAAAAVLKHPHDVAVLPDAVVVADSHNGAIRRIGADGVIRTIASGMAAPIAVAPAPDGGVYVAEAGRSAIVEVSATGTTRTVASSTSPFGLASDTAGNVYVSELESRRVIRIDAATGKVTRLAP